MNPQNLQQLLKVMEDMTDLELTLARLYQTCSEVFPEDTHFWNAIKAQEEKHADLIRKMAGMVAANPQEYTLGRNFNPTAIRTIKNGIVAHIDALKQGDVPRAKMLTIARDIEGSVLETNYREMIKTANVQFMELVGRIDSETSVHKTLMVKKIASTEVRGAH